MDIFQVRVLILIGGVGMADFTYDLLKKGIEVSALRGKSISSNIANVNTDNYKANVVPFEKVLENNMNNLRMSKTHKGHFGIDNIKDLDVREVKRENTYVNDNGNNVDLDLEMTELASNELYYNALVRQINSKLSSLNYVINR